MVTRSQLRPPSWGWQVGQRGLTLPCAPGAGEARGKGRGGAKALDFSGNEETTNRGGFANGRKRFFGNWGSHEPGKCVI